MSAMFQQTMSVLRNRHPETGRFQPEDAGTLDAARDGIDLTDSERKALWDLDQFYEQQSEYPRRQHVRKCLKAREYMRGNQYLVWDARMEQFRPPSPSGGASTSTVEDDQESAYTINIYQGFCLSAAQLIVSNRPTEKFFPESGEDPADVQAAKTADNVMRLHEMLSDQFDQLLMEWLFLWTDGSFGSYVRYVVDGNRFGYHDEPVMEPFEAKVSPDAYRCPDCGAMTSPEQNTMGICPDCGAALGPETFVAGPTVSGIHQTGTKKVPNGQEVRDVVGALELRLPHAAKEQWQFPYLKWNQEIDRALIRSTYPNIQDKIAVATT